METLKQDVLNLLKDDSRLSAEKIAVMLGSKKDEIERIIADFEQDGVIVKYTTVVNREKIDNTFVEALIEVKVTPQKSRGFDALAEEIYSFKEVKTLYLMSGGFDLAVFIEGKSLKDVAMFVSEKLSSLDTVTGTATHFILKKYKSDGVMLVGSEVIEREIGF